MLIAPPLRHALASPASVTMLPVLPVLKWRCEIVVCVTSANWLATLLSILSAIDPDFPVGFVVVPHRGTPFPQAFYGILEVRSSLPVEYTTDGSSIKGGVVYVAPPDCEVSITADRRFHVWHEPLVGTSKGSDALFASAAEAYDGRLVGLLLGGSTLAHTDGARFLRQSGGLAISPDEEKVDSAAAICDAGEICCVDFALPRETIGPVLEGLATRRPGRPARTGVAPAIERQITTYYTATR